MSLVRLYINGISYSGTQNNMYALILSEMNSKLRLPIIVGAFEAHAIATALDKEEKKRRPQTHDLFKNFADQFQIRVKQVVIHKFSEGIFYTNMICEQAGQEYYIEARPSDAIALAIRFGTPIFTYKDILNEAGIVLSFTNQEEDTLQEISYSETNQKKEWKSYLTDELKTLLNESLEKEDYETAAQIRDEINRRKTI